MQLLEPGDNLRRRPANQTSPIWKASSDVRFVLLGLLRLHYDREYYIFMKTLLHSLKG